MMKKIFITPSVRIYSVQARDIIATSTEVDDSGTYKPGRSPERLDFEDFDGSEE